MASPWFRSLLRHDPDRARQELIRIARRYRGNVSKMADELGYDRSHLRKVIWKHALWEQVDAIRAEAIVKGDGPDWLNRTREVLKR